MEAPRAIVPAQQMAFVQAGTGDATPGAAGWSRRVREDKRLFERYRRTGDREDRDELVARLLLLARLAWRYRDRDEYDDLVQVASCGLLKAIERYDPDRGHAFSTYAVPTIVGELKRYSATAAGPFAFRANCTIARSTFIARRRR